MYQNQVSRIHQHSTISRNNNSMIGDFGRKSTILSTKKNDMQRNLRSNILMNASHLKKVIYVRVNSELDSIETQKFKDNLSNQYQQRILFEFYKNIGELTKVKFEKEPISFIITTFEDRNWASKFSENIRNNTKLQIIIKCNDSQQFNAIKAIQNLKAVLDFDDLQVYIEKEYEMFSNNYVDQMNQKRIKNKFYYKANTNEIMNFYYHDEIQRAIEPYITKISKNKKFKKTNFFHFNTFAELVKIVKTRKTQKRNQTKVIQQSKIIMSNQVAFRSEGTILMGNQKELAKAQQSQDYFYLIVGGKHSQLKEIQKFWRSLKNAKILIIQNRQTLDKFKVQMNHLAQQPTDNQISDKERITMSEKLIVIVNIDDYQTIKQIDEQQNYNFHSEKALYTNDITLKAELWRIQQNDDYFGLLIIQQEQYYRYQTLIQSCIHLNRNGQIDNFRIVLKKRKNTSQNQNFQGIEYVQNPNTNKKYVTTPQRLVDLNQNQNESMIPLIYRARNVFYHPAQGLIGNIVYIFIKKQKQTFTNLILTEIRTSRRLKYEGYRDKQQLQYLLQHKTKNSECVLIIIQQNQLYQVRKLINKLQNVYILLIGNEEELLFDPQILKIGKEDDIRDFIRQIPQPDNNGSFIYDYIQQQQNQQNQENKIQKTQKQFKIKQQCIKRYEKEQNQHYFYQIPGRPIIVIYFPNQQHTQNAAIFQTRIIDHFHEEVTFKNYQNQAQIRDMDDTQQPLQFLIITDQYLNWTKKFAEQEKNKQFEILFFTKMETLSQFRQLIDKPVYKRFKIISNKWKYIEEYIIGKAEVFNKKRQDLYLNSNQNLHIFLALADDKQKQKHIELKLDQYAMDGNEIAKRCKFYYYDPTKQATLVDQLKKHNPKHKSFVIINQNNPAFLKENVVSNALKDYDNAKTILITTKSILDYNKPNAKTQIILQTQDQAIRYIADIGFRKTLDTNQQPIIFIDNCQLSWRYFIKKNAMLRKKFRFQGYNNNNNDLKELQYKIKNILNQSGDQIIWILTTSDDDCQILTEKFKSIKNVKFIVFDDKYKNPYQNKQIILGSCDRDQIQLYLLNYNKRSKTKIVPSQYLPAFPVLMYFNKLQISKEQLKYWRDRIGAKTIPFDSVQTLKNGLLARQSSKKSSGTPTVYLVITNQQQQQVNQIIKKIKNSSNIKKIIMNKIAIDRKTIHEHYNVCYLADTKADLNTFLENLRYTIRKPPRKIKQHFNYPITHIYLYQYDFDRQFVTLLERYNASLRVHFYKDLKDLQRSINMEVAQKSNLVVVGNSGLQNGLSPGIRKYIKYINSKKFAIDYEPSTTKILQADELNEVKLYLRNIPETRFDDAKKIMKKVHLYFSPFALKQQNMKLIKNKAKQISERNKGISLHGYQNLQNLGKFLARQNNKQKHILMLHKNEEAAADEWLQKFKSNNGNNQFINNIVYLENVTKRPKQQPQHKIFVSNSEKLIEEFLQNIPLIKNQNKTNDQSHSNIQLESNKSKISSNLQSNIPPPMMSSSKKSLPVYLQPAIIIRNSIKAFKFIQQQHINAIQYVPNLCQPIQPSQIINKPKYVNVINSRPIKSFIFQKQEPLNNMQFYCLPDEPIQSDIKPQLLPIQETKTKIGICYRKNHKPSQRTLDYILSKSNKQIEFNQCGYDDLNQLQDGGLAMIHDQNNKVIILTNTQRQCQNYDYLREKYPKCRLVRYSDINQIDLLFDLGWQKKNLQIPYKNQQVIKSLMQKSEKANVFIPIYKFNHTLYNFPNTTVHLYKTLQNVQNTIIKQNQSNNTQIIHIIVTYMDLLKETTKLQYLYPNVRLLVLCDDAQITEKQFFQDQGDKYCYYVDDKIQNIQKQLYKLFQKYPLGKNKSKSQFLKNILFYNKNQQQYLNDPQLDNYYKILYQNQEDLNKKISNLKSFEIPFILRTDNGDTIIQKLQNKSKQPQKKIQQKDKSYQINKSMNSFTQNTIPLNKLSNQTSQIKITSQQINNNASNQKLNVSPPTQINIPPTKNNISSIQINAPTTKVNIPSTQTNVLVTKVNMPSTQINLPPVQVNVPSTQFDMSPRRINIPSTQVNISQKINGPPQQINLSNQSNPSISQIKSTQNLRIIRVPAQQIKVQSNKIGTNSAFNQNSLPSHQIIKSQVTTTSTNRLPSQNNYLSTLQMNRIANLFPTKYLHSFLKIQYYYLSNVIMNSPNSPIKFMTKQDLQKEYNSNNDLLMIVFCEKGNQMFLPSGFLNNQRVKVILVAPGQQINDNNLIVQFNQKQNVVNTIRYFDTNVTYCLHKTNQPASQYKLHQLLSADKNLFRKDYQNLNHLKTILETFKYRSKFIHVICFKEQEALVKKIFDDLQIRSYHIHVVAKILKRHRRDILNINEKMQYDLVGIDVKNDEDPNKQLWRILNSPNRIIFIDKNNNSQTLKQVVEKQRKFTYDKKNMAIDETMPTIVAIENDVPESVVKQFGKLNNCFIIYNAKGKPAPNLPYNNKTINNWRELQFLLNPQKQKREINTQEYDNVRVVYESDIMDKDNKIRLLLMSQEKQEIIPTKYIDNDKLQNLIQNNNQNLFVQVIGQQNSEKIKNNNSVDMHNKQFKEFAKKKRMNLPYYLDIIHQQTQSELDQNLSKYNHLSQKQIDELLLISEIKKNEKKKSKPDDSLNLIKESQKQEMNEYSLNDTSKLSKKKKKLNKIESTNGFSGLQVKNNINSSILNNRSKMSQKSIKKINQNLYKFRPILNGQFIKILVPTQNKELQAFLKNQIEQLMRIQYFSFNDLQSYLQRNTKDPTIVLLSEDFLHKVNELQQKYSNIRIIMYSNNLRKFTPAAVSLDLDSNGQIAYLMKQLIKQNQITQKRLNTEGSKIKIISNGFLTQNNKSRIQTLPLNFNINNIKIKIFYNPLKNTNIKLSVEKANPNKVQFIEYTTPITLKYKLQQLAVYSTDEELNLIIQNQDQIEQIEQLKIDPTIQAYFIRYISNQYKDYDNNNEKVIFTGFTSHEIANYINNLLSSNKTGNKRYPYFRSGKSILINSHSEQNLKNLSEQKKYRRKYIPSTFGTAPRFQYYDDKYIPIQITTTSDSVRDSSLDAKPFRRFRIKQKSNPKKGLIFRKRESAAQSPYML